MPAATRDPENENMKPGSPPNAATGSSGAQSSKTKTDPASGEGRRDTHAPNKSAAETEAPAAQKDNRITPGG